ncbi:RHS repeat-associated core domain-containing protein, partial [Streptomyces sp. NPDC004542]|uniref:RHS repeat-associated core domain-containing protein n=1 Tax=Streptomyces sp. NPDC004542 TaxID=3154281 RepID=UPI0033B34690
GALASTLTYDTTTRTTRVTDSLGHTRVYEHNEALRLVRETDPLGHVTSQEWDRELQLVAVTDPLGHTIRYDYDEQGHVVSVTRPDGRTAHSAYNTLGLPTSIIEADGTEWRREYDECGNLIAATDPSGVVTRSVYDSRGCLTRVVDALGHTTWVQCDLAGLPVTVTNPLGAITRYERDAFGRPLIVTGPAGDVTRLKWTAEGRLTRRTASDGTIESWTYDGEGNCISHTDPGGRVTRYEYTHFDLVAARTEADGSRYEFAYDTELRLTRVAGPRNLTWNYTYDPAGQLIAESDFDDLVLAYAYDAAGRLTSRTNALGQTVSFEHNALGQVVRKDAAGRVTSYVYDVTDQLARAVGPDGTTLEVQRDRFGRVQSETVDGRTMAYAHDELGRLTTRTTPAGAITTWSYDAAGRRIGMVASGRPINATYDAAGREVARSVGNAVALEHSFDVLGRLTAQSVTATGGHLVQHRSYTYRADGALIGIDDRLSGSRRFHLDVAGRVTSVNAANWTETYVYDSAGNQTQAHWPESHSGGAALGAREYTGTCITRAGRVRYEHDALGRITMRQKPRLFRKPDTWRYEWDVEDRLTAVTTPDGTRWRYAYDPLGRRTTKLRLSDDGKTAVERVVFTWDGTVLGEQTTTSPNLPHPVTLTWDYEGTAPIAQTERITVAGAPQEEVDFRFFAIVTDLVGSPSELIDERGDIAWRARSTLWGETAWPVGSTAYTPLRFPGQYFDPETGLHYNYFRHYDPQTARYLTPDPLGLAASPNPRNYVVNPHMWTDSLGLTPCLTSPKSATELRNSPGAATGGFSLPSVSGKWLRGSEGNAGRIPGQVAKALHGREFSSFNDFRKAFWEQVSKHPELAGQFSKSGQTAMAAGKSPFVLEGQQVPGQYRYVLHHVQPIQRGGGVYDLDNIVVVTPRYHKEILDGSYHFGN